MLGNYNDNRSGSFMQELKDVLGQDLDVDELASVDLLEEDVRIIDQLDHFTPHREESRTLVMRDVYLDSFVADQSPDRSGALFSWDLSPDRGPNTPKRMKKSKTGGFGSSCSSPAMSDASDDGLSLLEYDNFSVGSSPLSGTLMEDIRALSGPGDELMDSFCWMGEEDPIFTTLITPPTPADGSLPWERSTKDRRKSDSKQSSYHSCSSNNSMWNSAKKWSQLRYDEQREALSGLVNMIEELGVREKLDLNHILNISPYCVNPVIDLNSLNDDKWKRVKNYMKKLMKTGKEPLSKPSSQLRAWQPSDHIYAPLKRPSQQPSSRVLPPPPHNDSQAQSRIPAVPHHTTSLVSSSVPDSRDSSSSRRPTLNLVLTPSKVQSVPSKKDFSTDKRNIIKARRKGVNRKYEPSKNSLLKKNVIQKITENANRVTKKGLRMKVDEKDVEKALSGCFDHEERVELSYNDVDEYIDVQA